MSKHDFKPPYVLIATFCDIEEADGQAFGLPRIYTHATLRGAENARSIVTTLPTLFLNLATPGMSGVGSVSAHHIPPEGDALPERSTGGPLNPEGIRVSFIWREPALLFEGLHVFEIRFNGTRLLTKVPFILRIERPLN